jgi:hypothetical protein
MRRHRRLAIVLVLGLAALPSSARATYHLTSISEIGVEFGGDPAAQFVEIRLDAAGRTNLADTRLTAFDAVAYGASQWEAGLPEHL